jgi:hypothetical protein
MKKILLILTVAASAMTANAQAPDFAFETWNNVPFSTTVKDPQGWASLNVLSVFTATPVSVTKETTTPYNSITAKVTTIKVQGAAIPNPWTGTNLDTVGLLAIGSTQISAPYIVYGKPYAWRPATLAFASKYTPVGNDSASVVAILTHWNGASRDTVASGMYSTGASSSTYSMNMVTMNYFSPTIMPDSEHVYISSSRIFTLGAQVGSSFWVDDLAWSGYVGTNDLDGTESSVSVYPNPASTEINLSCSADVASIEVMDVTGRRINVYEMKDNKVKIATGNYLAGFYLYTMYNKEKQLIHRGKFEVTK